MDARTIVKIGVWVTPAQLKGITGFLTLRKIPYYVGEPAVAPTPKEGEDK